MVEHIWSVLCLKQIVNKETNLVSLIEVLERLTGTGPTDESTVVPIPMVLVSLWGRAALDQPSRGRSRVSVLAPGGEQLGDAVEYDIDLSGYTRMRNQITFNAFPVRGSGKYVFLVELESNGQWLAQARLPLEVVIEADERPTDSGTR